MNGFVSAQTLLDFLRGNKPDLILLDIRMPEMDGTEAMGLIRALSETAAALEAASDRGDEETIRRKHPSMMAQYRALRDVLSAYVGTDASAPDGEEILEFMPD